MRSAQTQGQQDKNTVEQRKNGKMTSLSFNEPEKDTENMCVMKGERERNVMMTHIWLRGDRGVHNVILIFVRLG